MHLYVEFAFCFALLTEVIPAERVEKIARVRIDFIWQHDFVVSPSAVETSHSNNTAVIRMCTTRPLFILIAVRKKIKDLTRLIDRY